MILKVNVQEVLSTFDTALDKLEKDFDPSLLSKASKELERVLKFAEAA